VNDIRGDRTTTVLLAAEDVPTTYCNIHVETAICTSGESYHVANEYCAEKGTVEKYGLLNYSRQFPVADIVVTDQQYCVGVLVKQSGYSEARCDTLDPVNKVCTIHTASRQITTSRTIDNDDDDEDYDYDDDDDDEDDDEDDEYDPIVVLPTVQ
jgi:hypothetical protein